MQTFKNISGGPLWVQAVWPQGRTIQAGEEFKAYYDPERLDDLDTWPLANTALHQMIQGGDVEMTAGSTGGSGSLPFTGRVTNSVGGWTSGTDIPKGTDHNELWRVLLGLAEVISLTVTPAGDPTNLLTLVFESDLPTDLADAEITLSSGLTKGALTKVDERTYTLAVTTAAVGATPQTLTITRQDALISPVTFSVSAPEPTLARYTVTANGGGAIPTTQLTITFTSLPELVTPDLTAAEITLSAGLTKGAVTKVNATTYTLGVTVQTGGAQSVTITKTDVSPAPVAVAVSKGTASFTVTAGGTPYTNLLTFVFTNSHLVTPDLTAAEITLSSGMTKGALTKVNASTYTLAVSANASGTSSQTARITKTDVATAAVTVSVEGPPEGWYGVAYNHLQEPPLYANGIVPPTEAEILALTSKVVVTGQKRNMNNIPINMHPADWSAAVGRPESDINMWGSGRAFFITRSWGEPIEIVTSGFPAKTAFDPVTVVVQGITYTGMIANGAPPMYDGTPYNFQFV